MIKGHFRGVLIDFGALMFVRFEGLGRLPIDHYP